MPAQTAAVPAIVTLLALAVVVEGFGLVGVAAHAVLLVSMASHAPRGGMWLLVGADYIRPRVSRLGLAGKSVCQIPKMWALSLAW